MWEDPDFITRTGLAAAAFDQRWSGYADYCRLRDLGLRRTALEVLDTFLAEATAWPLADRMIFTRWVLDATGFSDFGSAIVPEPLLRKLARPAVREHAARNPESAEARAMAGFLRVLDDGDPLQHYQDALALEPGNALAARLFTRAVLSQVDYAQHELPHLYLGNPEDDIALLERTAALNIGPAQQSLIAEFIAAARTALQDGAIRGS